MASRDGGVLHDQNLNLYLNGEASAGWKNNNVSKVPRKGGGLGGRTPLGDLSNSLKPSSNQISKKQLSDVSNSLKPSANQMSKKQNSGIFSVAEKDTFAPQITDDASKKKRTSKASAKAQTGGRRALSDISNSGKPHVNEASAKIYNAKLSVVAEEPIDADAILGERFLHNHKKCIKEQRRGMGLDQFLQTLGLDNGFSKPLATPRSRPGSIRSKPENPLKQLELEEMDELLPGKLDCPSPCSSPISPKYSMEWMDHDHVDFKLVESP